MKRAREAAHDAMEFTCCDHPVLGWSHSNRCADLTTAITARDAEHRAELDQCQTDLKSARHSLLQSDNQVARLVAENDRLKGELAKETKRSAALEALVDMERQVRKETENTLFFVRAELLKVQDDLLQGANREVMAEALIERLRGELGEAQRVISACAHVPCVLASMSRTPGAVPRSCGSCGTCSARKQLAVPPPAESTPVQRPQQAAPSGGEAKVLDMDDETLVAEIAFEVGQATKQQPEMGGRCRRLHNDAENRRIARAAIRAINRIARRGSEGK